MHKYKVEKEPHYFIVGFIHGFNRKKKQQPQKMNEYKGYVLNSRRKATTERCGRLGGRLSGRLVGWQYHTASPRSHTGRYVEAAATATASGHYSCSPTATSVASAFSASCSSTFCRQQNQHRFDQYLVFCII